MKKPLLYLLMIFTPLLGFSQVIINTTTYVNPTPQQSLVQNILLGNGITASNFTYQGSATALGFFKGLGTNLGLDSGIVMSTGNVADIGASNLFFASTDHIVTTPNDPDVSNILGAIASNDLAILEFDFVPQGDTVKFDYVFGSEEYPEFVCQFNDVFGFFLSGPGINGPFVNNAQNIALVPGTSTPVSIDNVNNGLNNDPNDPICPATNPQYYLINSGNDFSLDGYTTVLQAVSGVQCGETYHVKLVIADALDDFFDSGVFLKARSFVSSAVLINSATLSGDTTIVEGCASASFQFTRPASASGDTLVVNYNILGSATNGVDYTQIPDSVIFLPGETLASIVIQPINDGVNEPAETIIVELTQNICGSFTQQSILYIVTPTPLSVVLQDTSLVCPTDSISLSPIITGGYPPFTYTWSSGQTTPSITISPDSSMTYFLVVSDTCGPFTDADSAVISVPFFVSPVYNVNGGTLNCANTGFTLNASVSGGFPPYSYTWYEIDPNFPFPLFISGDSSVVVFPSTPTQYIVEIVDACDPLAVYSDTVTVDIDYIPQVNLTAGGPAGNGYLVEGCATGFFDFSFTPTGTSNDSITVSFTIGGSAGNGSDYSLIPDSVTIPAGQSGAQISLSAFADGINEGVETIIITFNQNVCNYPSQTDTIFIDNHQPIQITNTDITLTCPGDTIVISAAFTGGYPPYTYSWSTGSSLDSIVVNPAASTTYTLTVNDTCGPSTDTQSITVNVPLFSPFSVSTNTVTIECPGGSDTVVATVSGGFAPYDYNWTVNANFIGNGQTQAITPSSGTNYIVTVSDACNTIPVQDTVEVLFLPYQLPQVNGLDVTVKCAGDVGTLLASPSLGRGPFIFNWSNGQTGLNDSIILVSGAQTQTFGVTITDACNNTSTPDSVKYIIPVYGPMSAITRTDTTVCPGFALSLPASASGGSGVYSFTWSSTTDPVSQLPGGGGVVTVNGNGIFTLTATDECQNIGVSDVKVEMLPGCEIDEVNVFTPNGDGKNDKLVFKNLEYFPNSQLLIFNRWGEKVYENSNYRNDWDGENLHAGTYFFNLTIPNSETRTGFFKLLK